MAIRMDPLISFLFAYKIRTKLLQTMIKSSTLLIIAEYLLIRL